MGISEIFGNSFAVLRKNPKIVWPLFLFSLIITALTLTWVSALAPYGFSGNSFMNPFGINSGDTCVGINGLPCGPATPPSTSAMLQLLPELFGFIGLIVLVSFFVGILITGLYVSIAEQGYKKQKVSLSTAFNVAKAAYLRLLAAAIIYFIIIVVIAVVFVLILIAILAIPSHTVHIIGALLLFLIGVVAFVFIGLSFYQLYVVIVLEKRDPVDAIKRSMDIGKKLWGEILAVLIISIVIVSVIDLIGTLISVAIGFVFGAIGGATLGLIVRELVQLIITAFMAAWVALVPVFFYHDYVTSNTTKKPMKK